MKRIFKYGLVVLAMGLMSSCVTDKEMYDFVANPGAAVTFSAKSLDMPALKAEDGGKVRVPLYRGNTSAPASVQVTVTGGEGVFTPKKTAVDFAAGDNMGYLEFTYDYESLSAKPVTITVAVTKAEDVALNGIAEAKFTLVKQLTYESVGEGLYYTDWYEAEWPQEVMKAKEGDYFLLPSCWVSGVDFSFFCDGETVDWYTATSGYTYGSYGSLEFVLEDAYVVEEDGLFTVVVETHYTLPSIGHDFGVGVEEFTFPEGFTFGE